MAALNFPTSPQSGDIYSANGTTWIFDGVSWTPTITALTLGSAADAYTTGSELLTNPTFDGNADGWTLGNCATYSDGTVVFLNNGGPQDSPRLIQVVSLTAGKVYCLTVNLAAFNNDEASLWLYTAVGEYGVPCRTERFASLGENKTFITVATTQSVEISIEPWGWYVNAGFTVTSVSLKEVTAPSTGLTLFDANGNEIVDFNVKRFLGTSNLYIGSENPNDGIVKTTVAVGDKAASICTSEGNWHYGSIGNTAIGTQALENCTGAFWNTAIGMFSLMSNSGVQSSYFNAALGYGSFMKLGSGSPSSASYSNTAAGTWTGSEMLSGIRNTFVGASAAVWTDPGLYSYTDKLQAASDSVAVGAFSCIPNNASNCIAIGYEARCTENNSVVLGNNNITKTFLKGNVSIGATSPGAKLDVQSATEQLRLGYDASNYASFTVSSKGTLTLATSNTPITDGTDVNSILFTFNPTTNGNITSNYTTYNGLNINTEYSDTDNASHLELNGITSKITIKSGSGDLYRVNGANIAVIQEYDAYSAVAYEGITARLSSFGSNSNFLCGVHCNTNSWGETEATRTVSYIIGSYYEVATCNSAINAVTNVTTSIGVELISGNWAYDYSGCQVNTTNNYGILAHTGCYQDGSGDANITNNYGFYLKNDIWNTVSNGSITNHYGLYLESFPIATNEWGVYSAGSAAKNYFNGPVTIGTTEASAKIHAISTTEQLRLGYDVTHYGSFTVNSSGSLTVTPSSGLFELAGALQLTGAAKYTYTTPANGTVGTKILIPTATLGDYEQLFILGIGASSSASSRIFMMCDARTAAHQPSFGVFNPEESDLAGISWDGSNSTAYLKALTGSIGIKIGSVSYFLVNPTLNVTESINRFDVTRTTEQLRLNYDGQNYVSHTVDSSGNVLIDAVGLVKIGDGTNYAQFATDGTMTLKGTATAWDDLLVEMKESLKGTKVKPDWDDTNFGFLFPQNDTSEYVVFNVQLPHKWKEGSTVYPHVHIFQDQNATPTFKIDYRWVNIGDAVPSFTTGYTMGTMIGSQTWTSGMLHRVVGNATGISGSRKTMSSMLQVKLYRDDNAYTGDCLVVSFDVHIEVDSFGSSAEYTK